MIQVGRTGWRHKREMHPESALVMEPFDRFMSRVEYSETGCWLWTGAVSRDGYGHMGWKGTITGAHRVSYMLFIGPVPQGMEVDHYQCRNRRCVNPEHLKAVTHRENCQPLGEASRRRSKAQTHCRNGHEYTPENVYRDPSGWRHCRECGRQNAKRYYQERTATR